MEENIKGKFLIIRFTHNIQSKIPIVNRNQKILANNKYSSKMVKEYQNTNSNQMGYSSTKNLRY
jgi:hypothetical protein